MRGSHQASQSLFVDGLKIELQHGFLKLTKHLGVDCTQFLQWSVVGEQLDVAALQVGVKVVHPPTPQLASPVRMGCGSSRLVEVLSWHRQRHGAPPSRQSE